MTFPVTNFQNTVKKAKMKRVGPGITPTSQPGYGVPDLKSSYLLDWLSVADLHGKKSDALKRVGQRLTCQDVVVIDRGCGTGPCGYCGLWICGWKL